MTNSNNFINIFILFFTLQTFSNAKDVLITNNINSNKLIQILKNLKDYDIVNFKKGSYLISNLIITKKVTFLSYENAVINGSNKGTILNINSDSVTIQGLTFANTGKSYIEDYAAILCNQVKFLKISGNKIQNCFFAVYLKKSTDCLIENNQIIGNAKSEANSGNAVHLWNCKRITVLNNYLSGHRDGIYLEFTENNFIKNNYSYKNLRYGLHFMFSHNTDYISNTFKHNGAGVAVMFSKKINMIKNNFIENKGSASYGLLLKEISGGTITENIFSKNTVGIYAEGTNNMLIEKNRFEFNGWGIKMMSSCFNNSITLNNFYINSFDFSTNTNHFNSKIYKNFWSSYTGYDLDKDGIGDLPHKPMSLYAYLVQKSPESIILLRSIFMQLLDLLEKISPTVTPEYLNDAQPLIKEFKL